jgi:hypothetical protein
MMNNLRAGWHTWPGHTTRRLLPVVPTLAPLVAGLIATWAFVYGDQLVIQDAAGYYELGREIHLGGFSRFASDIRTFGYPAFLAVLMAAVGDDIVAV